MNTFSKPSVIIEQQEDGTMLIRYYVNGQRATPLPYSEANLKFAMDEAGAAVRRSNELWAERQAEKEQARRKRLWKDVAYGVNWDDRGHGMELADRCFGRDARPMRLSKVQPAWEKAVNSEDLL